MNIIVACTGGLSTSILVDRMKKEAESRGIECSIEAIGKPEIDKKIEEADFDVMLLSPQLAAYESEIKEKASENMVIELIDMVKFGSCDGHATLNLALELCGK
ncbi:PTS sugar transporter subunit IIB [Peptacetobacter hominis]|uniref:PTS sugar transporter subunit IIB n=1 Tax=Peptacetobacter hominis TaxID=2743610 RepID=A0A544QVM7_9FIRM|nr:PTS sugar transporter subunit IIB [Peptacetobacter hominis]TQQ84749.1 PTS sugar transporter subunit IIB [Peptacetobacter hominis]